MRLIICLMFGAFTQSPAQDSQEKIEVSYDKSSILVFSAPVKPRGWNCGLKELVGVSVLENKILLQSKEEHFEETNLIVELTDGSMYAFDLVYKNNPAKTFHVIRDTKAVFVPEKSNVALPPSDMAAPQNQTAITTDSKKNKSPGKVSQKQKSDTPSPLTKEVTHASSTFEQEAVTVAKAPDYLKRIGIISKKMFLFIGGIYALGDKIYFKVNLKNVSSIPYDIDYAQFLIKNRKSALTRTSSALAEELTPLHILQSEGLTVNKDQTLTIVYVFEKFTISDDKKLHLEFWEKNGDRSLELPVESIEILNAKNQL